MPRPAYPTRWSKEPGWGRMHALRETGDPQQRTSAPDIYIAGRVRMARKLVGLSQEQLAERVGVTFQQIQKYEAGVNRISASRLYQIALVFSRPVSFFLPQMPGEHPHAGGSGPSDIDHLIELMRTPEATSLHTAYMRIKDAEVRRRVLALVRSIADGSG